MNLSVEAVYTDGVLRPIQSIDLPEGAQVSLIIQAADIKQIKQSSAQILAAIAAMPLEARDPVFSNRDHDQVLYTTEEEP